jgi:hypothetical protein
MSSFLPSISFPWKPNKFFIHRHSISKFIQGDKTLDWKNDFWIVAEFCRFFLLFRPEWSILKGYFTDNIKTSKIVTTQDPILP